MTTTIDQDIDWITAPIVIGAMVHVLDVFVEGIERLAVLQRLECDLKRRVRDARSRVYCCPAETQDAYQLRFTGAHLRN